MVNIWRLDSPRVGV